MRILKNRRGTAMVEAAIVFPPVIISVTAVILILVFLCRQVVLQADMHMAARADAGEKVEIFSNENIQEPFFSIRAENAGSAAVCSYEGEISLVQRSVIDKRFKKTLKGESHASREVNFVRTQDLIFSEE